MAFFKRLTKMAEESANRPPTRNEKLLYAAAFCALGIAWLAEAIDWYWCILPALYLAGSLWHSPKSESAPAPVAPTTLIPASTLAQQTARSVDTAGVALPCAFHFSYFDQHGNHAPRTVKVDFVSRNSNTGLTYLEGFCHDRMEHRTFRTDRINGDLTDINTGELIPVAHLLSISHQKEAMVYTPPQPAPQSRTSKKWQTAVFFAGFRGGKLEELEGLAAAAGWQIRWTISPTVDYVVRNGSAGHKQIADAASLGIALIDENTFRALAS